jgi:hypothetical protein
VLCHSVLSCELPGISRERLKEIVEALGQRVVAFEVEEE